MKRLRGFTLLEVLVALTILSISLGVLMQVFGGGLRSAVLAEEYSQAALHAESLLTALGVENPLTAGSDGGRIDDRYSWRSTVEPFVLEDVEINEAEAQAYRVVLEVSWDEGERTRSVVLETLRVIAPDATGKAGAGAATAPTALR